MKPALVARGVLDALWPAGAPPFARAVNIACLVANIGAIAVAPPRRPARSEHP